MTRQAGHDTQTLLSVTDLTVGFADARGILLAADRVSFELHRNQTLGLLGESGCGKSVTLRSILGLVPYPGEVIAGRIQWNGRDLIGLSRREMGGVRAMDFEYCPIEVHECAGPGIERTNLPLQFMHVTREIKSSLLFFQHRRVGRAFLGLRLGDQFAG